MKKYTYPKTKEDHNFHMLPKALFGVTKYESLCNEAKILYALLVSRVNLSKWNPKQFRDGRGPFCFFTREEAVKVLNRATPYIIKAFRQLREANLISEFRQGTMKANKIYVHPPVTEIQYYEELTRALDRDISDQKRIEVETNLARSEARLKETGEYKQYASGFDPFSSEPTQKIVF